MVIKMQNETPCVYVCGCKGGGMEKWRRRRIDAHAFPPGTTPTHPLYTTHSSFLTVGRGLPEQRGEGPPDGVDHQQAQVPVLLLVVGFVVFLGWRVGGVGGVEWGVGRGGSGW